MKLFVLVGVLLVFASSLELRRHDDNVDFSGRASPFLRRRPRETSNDTFILDSKLNDGTVRYPDWSEDLRDQHMGVTAKIKDFVYKGDDNKSVVDVLQSMISTPQGICMYSLPAHFNLGLLNSTFSQPVPVPLNISPSSTPPLQGLFDTIQFSLERIFYDRFLAAATETRPAKDCVMFYVPYFVAWETSSVQNTWINAYRPELDAELLTHLPHYNSSGLPGQNHFFVIGRISINVHHFIAAPAFKNAVKLVLEDTAPGEYPNVVAIPYPTWFRYYPGLEPRLGQVSTINVLSTVTKFDRTVKDCNSNWYGNLTEVLRVACDGKDFCSYHIEPQLEQWVTGYVYEGMDANGQWWPVTIKQKNQDGTFAVDVHDGPGTHWPRVYTEHLRKRGQTVPSGPVDYTNKCPALDVSGSYSCGGKTYTFKSLPGQVAINHALVLGCPRGPCWLWGTCSRQRLALAAPATQSSEEVPRTGPLLAMIGSARQTEYERIQLFRMCEERPQLCATFHTGPRENSTSFVHNRIADMYQLLMASTFCVNPPGDTPTRKGLFDSLVVGCIPVVTSEDSLQHYRIHVPSWRNVSVIVTTDQLFSRGFNLVDFLDTYARDHAQEVAQKQEMIRTIAYGLQYSFSPSFHLSRGPDGFGKTLEGLLTQPWKQENPKDYFVGVYSITGTASNRRLFATGSGDYATEFGASPAKNITDDQKWLIVGRGDGSCCYRIVNAASGRALYAQVEATDWSKFGASKLTQPVWADQKWRLNAEGDDTYNIVNVASGRRLFALPGHTGNIGVGATLDGRDQKWQRAWRWKVQKVA